MLRLSGPQGRQGLGSSSRLAQEQGQGQGVTIDESSRLGQEQTRQHGIAPGQGLGSLSVSDESEQGLALCSIALGLAGITQRLEQPQEQEQGKEVATRQGLEPGQGRQGLQGQPVSVLPSYFARQLLLAAYRYVTQVRHLIMSLAFTLTLTPLCSLYIPYCMYHRVYIQYVYRRSLHVATLAIL